MSRTGVFCVFVVKPCRSTMHSRSTQNRTRAIRPCGRLLRTSHISLPSERTRGIPMGHENSTSLISSPMILRSTISRLFKPFPHWLAPAVGAIEAGGQALESCLYLLAASILILLVKRSVLWNVLSIEDLARLATCLDRRNQFVALGLLTLPPLGHFL